jgi:hypothetical protein
MPCRILIIAESIQAGGGAGASFPPDACTTAAQDTMDGQAQHGGDLVMQHVVGAQAWNRSMVDLCVSVVTAKTADFVELLLLYKEICEQQQSCVSAFHATENGYQGRWLPAKRGVCRRIGLCMPLVLQMSREPVSGLSS